MKYHVEGGCNRNPGSDRLTRAAFLNTLSNQRCRTCWRITAGEAAGGMAAQAVQVLVYNEQCATNPHDQISIRANSQTDYVMLTAHDSSGHSAIDLHPDNARDFAVKLFEAAELIDGKKIIIKTIG